MHNYQKLLIAMVQDNYLDTKSGDVYLVTWQHDLWCNFFAHTDDQICNCNPDALLDGKRLKIPWKYKRLLRNQPTVQ